MSPEAHRLLRFALRYPDGWHPISIGLPQNTRRAISALCNLGYLEIERRKRPELDHMRLYMPNRPPPASKAFEVVVNQYVGTRMIEAIKLLRGYVLGFGLKDAKEAVELLMKGPIAPAFIVHSTENRNNADMVCGIFREAGFFAEVRIVG